ncbi:CopD family protein [Alteromonas oceanisediminis]|uniref:CopD family protein n=1 Tax=Alteromonas oceanisediminis TaxID=2836180 RepID=UPI001BDB5C06|nr:CopD family protein [Alteromonas oceanisediminis]MBT0586193.1 CopD family protein [Alteromonas oceanisediminis]
MLWFLSLHIAFLIIWIASALYIPVLIAMQVRKEAQFMQHPTGMGSVARLVFTHIASPAAVISIIAGTLTFVVGNILSFWLVAKLTLVTFLVIFHACLALLITRMERDRTHHLQRYSWALFIALSLCMVGILSIVIMKPTEPGFLPWTL